MNQHNPMEQYFGVFAESKTYMNLLYLLLAFPLGLAYFVLLITGFATGIPLIIIWVGLLILVLVFAISWALTAFERWLAMALLREQIPPMTRPIPAETSFWGRLKDYLANPVTWKGVLFLFLKFPIGLFTFIVTITGLSVSLSFILAPLLYRIGNIRIWYWRVDTMAEAAGLAVIGILILPAILHLFNWIAYWLGRFARSMLGIHSAPAAASISEVSPPTAYSADIQQSDT